MHVGLVGSLLVEVRITVRVEGICPRLALKGSLGEGGIALVELWVGETWRIAVLWVIVGSILEVGKVLFGVKLLTAEVLDVARKHRVTSWVRLLPCFRARANIPLLPLDTQFVFLRQK
jgi:hypothetical protein